MRSRLPSDVLSDLEVADLTFGSKGWDRRRPDHVREWAIGCLEHAETYLVEDQMRPERVYCPGVRDAVHLIREAMAAIDADAVQQQRGARVAAAWLPKCTLARQARDDGFDA